MQVYKTLIEDTDSTLNALQSERDKYRAEVDSMKKAMALRSPLESIGGKK